MASSSHLPRFWGPCEVVAETQSWYAVFCSFFIVHWWVSLGRSHRRLLVVASLHILPSHPDFLNWKLETTFPRWPRIEVAADRWVPCGRRGSGDSSRGAQHLFLLWLSFPCPVTSIMDHSGRAAPPRAEWGAVCPQTPSSSQGSRLCGLPSVSCRNSAN